MDWKNAVVPTGGKLFKAHHFTYMSKGNTYSLEIDEYLDGTFTGHGEHSTDQNLVIQSVSADNLGDCLTRLVEKIEARD